MRILREVHGATPAGSSPQPGERNDVRQTVLQAQNGRASTRSRTQRATQTNITIQTISLAGLVSSTTGLPSPAASVAVDQTVQAIVQVQIGCLSHCDQTEQHQQATQSTTSVQAIVPGAGSAPTAPSRTVAAISTATQLTWQLQIGCLFWCNRATESQRSAGSEQAVQVASARPALAPRPLPAPSAAEPTARRRTGTAWSDVASLTPAPRFARSERHLRARRRADRDAKARAHAGASAHVWAHAGAAARAAQRGTRRTAGVGARPVLLSGRSVVVRGRSAARIGGGWGLARPAPMIVVVFAVALGLATCARAMYLDRGGDP
ncbi:MAG TPA: hypothetical protein VMU39_22430 [Solirubrobacteraceae bacterium]|nr:hypothetical protein [Solirubrobacteraceae bacterium]